LIDIDTQGAAVIRNCGDPVIRDALADVFIMPPDLEELRKRLLKRGTETASKSIRVWPLPPGDGTLARLPLYYYQWIGGGRFAEVPANHGGRKLFEPTFDREMIAEGRDSKRKRDKASARKVVRIRPGTKSVVLGVTGSIAAYKSAELASLLVKQGHEVFVVMTRDATEFISPLTLQTLSKNPVTTSFFDEKESWRPGHIELADRANLLLIAPATAHIIAELAQGLADHPLAAIALATRAPILLAPAMNGKMWGHPATVDNVEKLKARGVDFIGPEEGMLACGYEGIGRLWKVNDIAFRAEFLLARQDNLIA
jgi:3-polyprenyl-4-hydroxybenzoate decarboxylase